MAQSCGGAAAHPTRRCGPGAGRPSCSRPAARRTLSVVASRSWLAVHLSHRATYSGAAKLKVPSSLSGSFSSLSSHTAEPKSPTFQPPSLVWKTFSGLMSRCAMPCAGRRQGWCERGCESGRHRWRAKRRLAQAARRQGSCGAARAAPAGGGSSGPGARRGPAAWSEPAAAERPGAFSTARAAAPQAGRAPPSSCALARRGPRSTAAQQRPAMPAAPAAVCACCCCRARCAQGSLPRSAGAAPAVQRAHL
jgi:hypothetical protein